MHFLCAMLLAFQVSAAAKSPDPLRPLKDTIVKIRKAKMTDFELEKQIVSVLDTTKTYKGEMWLAGERFRFESKDNPKTLIVYDGRTLWVVQYPDKDFGGAIQVSRGHPKGRQKDQLILTELLSRGKILDYFDIKKTGEDIDLVSYEGTPKDNSLNIKQITVRVDPGAKQLKFLEYVDDVGNKTVLTVVNERINGKKQPELFKYKPEKGAQVNDL